MKPLWLALLASAVFATIFSFFAFSAYRLRLLLPRWPRLFVDILILAPLVLPCVGEEEGILWFISERISTSFYSYLPTSLEIFFYTGDDTPLPLEQLMANGLLTVSMLYACFAVFMPRVSTEIIDAARLQGLTGWGIFRHVTLPLSGKWIAGGWLFAFIRAIGTFH